MSNKIYAAITSQILEAMEKSSGEVELPWRQSGNLRPMNVLGHVYHGVNVLSLWVAARKMGYLSSQWGTYKQWQKSGGQVRKGEKSSLVVFYKQMARTVVDETSGEEETRSWPLARFSWVFNRDQVEIEDDPEDEELVDRVEELPDVERFVENTGARILVGGSRAFYRPATDTIHMPERRLFTGTSSMDPTESWFSVELHEITHWTSTEERCNRNLGKRFGDQARAMEELIAEIGSAFLCADLGISPYPREDHAHYLKNWISVLKEDDRAIFTAAQAAEKAVGYLKQLQSCESIEAA